MNMSWPLYLRPVLVISLTTRPLVCDDYRPHAHHTHFFQKKKKITKMFKFLNLCFARLRFWKSVSSKTAVAPSRFHESETLFQNRSRAKHWFKNLNILGYKKMEISCSIRSINFHHDFISKIGLKFWQPRAKPAAYFNWPWCLLGGYSSQTIKGLRYELKLADDPYVLTKVCKLLFLTYYTIGHWTWQYHFDWNGMM